MKKNKRKKAPRQKGAAFSRKGPQATAKTWSRQGDMMIRGCGTGDGVRYPGAFYSTEKIRWVSRKRTETGLPAEIRNPQEKNRVYPFARGFTAAGKRYADLGELRAQSGGHPNWYRDIYGREVLCLAKHFPCFDCFDAVHEHRFYRWFFLREANALTRVYFADESEFIYVTEDVENVEDFCWEEMNRLGYFDKTFNQL